MKIIERKLKIGDVIINYAEAGDGKAMIFLSNGGGLWQSWYYQIKHFSSKYKVYAIDWPGCGESSLTDEPYSLDFLSLVFEKFIEKIQLKNIVLIGNCIGSTVSLKYGISHPENVSRLVLFNICPGERIFPGTFIKKLIHGVNRLPRIRKVLSSLMYHTIRNSSIKQIIINRLFAYKYDRNSILYRKLKEKMYEKKQAGSRMKLLFCTHTFTLNRIIPTDPLPDHLLIWGEENRVASLEKEGQYHFKLLNSSSFKTIPSSGHLCMYEIPDIANQLIEDYILIS